MSQSTQSEPALAELHVHLDGSIRPATLLELAKEQGLEWAGLSSDELLERVAPPKSPPSLPAYLRAFSLTTSAMQTEQALERIAYELVLDHWREACTALEVRYCPSLLLNGGLNRAQVISAVNRGLARGELETSCRARQIICALRSFDPQDSVECARAAVRALDERVVGFDLAGNEHACNARDHYEAFAIAAEAGLGITCHAGEVRGVESIHDALGLPGISRIGHGTALGQDTGLARELASRGFAIEVCLTSNEQTGSVSKLAEHPLPMMLEAGLRVVLCTDNRLVSNTTLKAEYSLAAEVFGFSEAELLELAADGARAAFTDV